MLNAPSIYVIIYIDKIYSKGSFGVDAFLTAIYAFGVRLGYAISHFRIVDLLDILVVAFIVYKAIGFLRDTRAGQLVKGIVILLLAFFVANWWDLVSIKWLLSNVFDFAIIAAAVIFQPEIRRILEKVGNTNFAKGQLLESERETLSVCIDKVTRAVSVMQEKKIGALIVFERATQLGEIVSTGTIINADPSASMINNIFFPKSPLHDGAMIIRDGRIYAAGCILPLTQREDLSLQLGTRHRAAIGMTENSDAVVLVVSEETGTISLVSNGQITRNYNPVSAGAELRRLLVDSNTDKKDNLVKSLVKKVTPNKRLKGKEGKD